MLTATGGPAGAIDLCVGIGWRPCPSSSAHRGTGCTGGCAVCSRAVSSARSPARTASTTTSSPRGPLGDGRPAGPHRRGRARHAGHRDAAPCGPARGGRATHPGQHVALTVSLDGARRTRCFSISSSPHRADGLVELTVKANGRGGVSDHLVRRAQVGDLVGLAGGGGRLRPARRRGRRTSSWSAAAAAITPVLSMLRALADEVHGGGGVVPPLRPHAPPTIAAADELAAVARRRADWRVVVALTGAGDRAARRAESPHGARPAGRFRADAPRRPAARRGRCPCLGVRPGRAGRRGRGGLAGRGLDRARPRRALPARPRHAGRRHRRPRPLHGQRRRGRPTTAARSSSRPRRCGLTPAFGCRAGQCHTCIRRKPTGAVRDVRTGDVIDEPDALVQLCVSVPQGNVEIDSR